MAATASTRLTTAKGQHDADALDGRVVDRGLLSGH